MKTYEKPKTCKFNHRPTMAALSTSINIDVLGVLEKSNGNINALRKAKSRPIKHRTQSDMIIHSKKRFGVKKNRFFLIFFFLAQKPVTLLNTSISLDVLDIILRENQQLSDDECIIINNDDHQDVLPLPLWDRIRQRTAV